MKSQLKWLATATCAAVWSVFGYATEITVDNFTAVQSVTGNNGGNYAYFQFALDDSRMATSDGSTLADEVVVSKIAVGQRNPTNSNTYSIAEDSWLLIQEVTALGGSNLGGTLGVTVATTAPLTAADKTASVSVGTSTKTITLCTWTLTTPVRLSKSKTYRATFYNASNAPVIQALEMVTVSNVTVTTNTKIHASADASYSPYVRVTVTDDVEPVAGGAKSATLTEDGTWADLPWNPEGTPAIADTVTLSADAARTVTLADKVAISGLTLSGTGPFNFAAASGQAPMLIAYVTAVNADTDVSAITANLGALSIGSGKTLTIAPSTSYSSLLSGTTSSGADDTSRVVVDATTSALSVASTDSRSAALKSFTGVVEFNGSGSTGATVEFGYANAAQAFKPRFIFNGGTHTMKYGCGDNLFSPGGTDAKPTISVEEDTDLTFVFKDLSGWNGTTAGATDTPPPSVIRVGKNGSLTFDDNGSNTGYFRDRILLDSGAEVTNNHSGFYFYGGVAGVAQLAMLDNQGTATWNGGFKTDKSASKVEIGANSTLCLNGVITGSQAITKAGAGMLTLTGVSTNTATLTISAGTVKLQDTASWTGPIANSGTLEVASATDKTLANTLSGAGTVKKSGEGTLSLTGTMSNFTGSVEVSGGTLAIGTARPAVNALETGAVLKLTATEAELIAQTIRLTAGSAVTSVAAEQVAVVTAAGAEVAVSSVSLENGTLTLALANVLPTLTVTDDMRTWTNSTDWPTSGTVKIDATAVTSAATVTIPAPESTRTFSSVVVAGPTGVQMTFETGSNTINNLIIEGSVAMAVTEVNAITNPVTVNAGGVFEVVAASDDTLSKAISGAGKFAKGGAGVLTLGANIATTGGSIVQQGTLKFSSNGYVNASNYNTATGDVTVGAGATLDLNGRADLFLRKITLAEGATYQNSGSAVGDGSRQLHDLVLTGNATVTGSNFGLVASGFADATLDLGGYTLTKEGGGSFWLTKCTISNGTLKVKEGAFIGNSKETPCTLSGNVIFERAENAAETARFDFTQGTITDNKYLKIDSGARLTTAGPAVADGIKLGYTVLIGDLVANNDVSIAHLKSDADKTLTGTGTITVKDATLGESVTLTTLANMVLDLSAYTEVSPKSIAAKVVVGEDSGTRDSVTLTTKGYLTLSNGSNKIAETGKLVVDSGITTLSAGTQGLQGNLAIASGATLKSGSNDVPRWGDGAQKFDIAGTLELTGTTYWSINSASTVALHEGARLKGTGAENGRAFDFFDGGSITADGNATIEARLGDHTNPNTVTITQSAGITTITGEVRDGVTLEVAGAGTVVYAPAASVTGTSSPLVVDTGATLQLTPGATFALNGAVSGKGKLVLGDGTTARAFTSTRTYLDVEDEANLQSLTVQVKPSATLTLNPGADNFAFPIATVFDVASEAELILASGKSFFGVSGAGSCSVTGDYLFGVSGTAAEKGFPDTAKVLDVATLTIGSGSTFSVRPFGAIAIAPTTLTVEENAVIARDGYTSAEADATISLGATASVTGQGTINLPVAFNEAGSVLDTVTAAPLQLNGTVTGKIKVKLASGITTAKEILVTDPSVKLDRVTQLAFSDDATSQQYKTGNFCFVESVFDSRHTFTVSAPLTLTSLSDSVTDSEVARNAIYAAVESIRDTSSVTTIKEIDARSTNYEVLTTSSADALALFENLTAWAEPITGDGAVAGEGKVVVMYDFGISQLLVKNASLVGAEEAKLYVLLCAKVASAGTTPADYVKDTQVTLYQGETALSTALTPTVEQLADLEITPAAGERWFAVPMEDLTLGTTEFKVKASKAAAAN